MYGYADVPKAWVFECALCVMRAVGGCEYVCELYTSTT